MDQNYQDTQKGIFQSESIILHFEHLVTQMYISIHNQHCCNARFGSILLPKLISKQTNKILPSQLWCLSSIIDYSDSMIVFYIQSISILLIFLKFIVISRFVYFWILIYFRTTFRTQSSSSIIIISISSSSSSSSSGGSSSIRHHHHHHHHHHFHS